MASIEQQCLPNRIHECEPTEFLERFGTSFVPFEDACGLLALTDPPLYTMFPYIVRNILTCCILQTGIRIFSKSCDADAVRVGDDPGQAGGT